MLITLANVLYVLVAVAMIGFILVQRGPGADAGSGFGGGASATVFGARGSANFLSKSTAVLATLFFLISLGMAMYERHSSAAVPVSEDLGVMSAVGAAPVDSDDLEDQSPSVLPAVGNDDVPAAPVEAVPEEGGNDDVPAAPAAANDPAAAEPEGTSEPSAAGGTP
ncbi:MAG: preprotein translocase subunit SecG [Xanthomonadales bacterium]|nr:preprotein translocase subunit SecG [Xanthomonadales bacterium]